jgi:hypothetical protein
MPDRPNTPAGYSGTPLPRKLGIKPGHRVALLRAPDGFEPDVLGQLPDGVAVRRSARGPVDVIVSFHTHRADFERRLATLRAMMEPDAGLWIAWPKKASKIETDLSFETVQATGLAHGLVDNKSCAIDESWQALRFVYRLADR